MSYIKVELGGKERGLKFNAFAKDEVIKKAYKIEDKKVVLKYPDNNSAFQAAIIWGGLKGNDFAKDQDSDYTWEDVTEWIDSAHKEDIEKAVKAFTDSEAYKQAVVPEVKDKGEKKRNTKR